MKHRLPTALCLALLGWVAPAPGQQAKPEPLPQPRAVESDFRYVPDDCVAFVHVRVGSLLDKLKLKNRVDSLAPLKMGWESMFGVAITEVESVTLIGLPGESGTMTFLVRTAKPFKESVVTHLAEAGSPTTTKVQGKTCVSSDGQQVAVSVLNTHAFLLSDKLKNLEPCLKQAAMPRDEEALAEALKTAEKHDLTAWGDFKQITGAEELKLAMMPRGVETGTVTLDVGEEIALSVRVECEDAAAREWAAKGLKAGIDLIRAQALMMVGMADSSGVLALGLGDPSGMAEFNALPMKLIRQAEKGLQSAKVRTDDSSVTLTVAIPVDSKTLRSELISAIRLMDGFGVTTTEVVPPTACPVPVAVGPGMTLPPNQPVYLPPPLPSSQPVMPTAYPAPVPQVYPNPAVPQQMIPATNIIPVAATVPQIANAPQPVQPVPPSVVPPTVSAPAPSSLPIPTVVPTPVPQMPIPATPPMATTTKVSVANVRKETALLFSLSGDGKMNFVQKVPAGDAIDVDVTVGTHWIAVFSSNPAGETKTVAAGDKVWLLR